MLLGPWQGGMDEVNPAGVTKVRIPKEESLLSDLGILVFVRQANASPQQGEIYFKILSVQLVEKKFGLVDLS